MTATKIAAAGWLSRLCLKASNGGGGRGMRIVNQRSKIWKKNLTKRKMNRKKLLEMTRFSLKSILSAPKHIEVQIIGDNYGNVVHLYDRDCSVQRRHQKVVEYAPAFSIPEAVRQEDF